MLMGRTWAELLDTQKFGGSAETGGQGGAGLGVWRKGAGFGHIASQRPVASGEMLGAQVQSSGESQG